MTLEVSVAADVDELADQVAALFVDTVASAIARRGDAQVVFTGGSTGIAVLRAIATSADAVDWAQVHVWWGDERFVPHDSSERNDIQADQALLSQVPIAPNNVHRIAASDGEFGADPDAAASAYAAEIERCAASRGAPRFDILMLGVGEEGHTASIFPHSPAATDQGLTCAVRDCPKPPPTRVTLTQRLLSEADEVWLMTAGESKAQAVALALGGADPVDIPAAGPRGERYTRWFLDSAAAADLPR